MKRFFRNKNMNRRGFTLIELLVVISIIALLSSIVLASLNSAREKARVSAFLQNIRQFQLALEVYKNDKGYYPLGDIQESRIVYNYSVSADPGNVDNIDEALTDFVPEYLPNSPMPIGDSASDVIFYVNTYEAQSSYPLEHMCGDKTIYDSGYVIMILGENAVNLLSEKLPDYIVPNFNTAWFCLTNNNL
jgi:prepilin-type N-terminal cleavage/methylation domain-containing protein